MQQLGAHQLLRRIGRGGMAEVWSAKRSVGIGVDKFVAIKLLAPHLTEQSSYRDMFLAEARLSMVLNHSNIVQVFDAIDDPPDCYMVMELVEGMTLSQLQRALVQRGEKIPLDVGAYVIGELLRALAYAHGISLEAGSMIVHRDVSPQNVMVTTSGEVKLMDFGIARFASEDTQGMFVKGKLQYMPPEQLRKQTRRPTIDLFAVGGILHELLEGRRFRGNIDQDRLFGMVLQGEVPPLETDSPVPIEIDELRLALLEPDEDLRVPTAKDGLLMLQRWSGYRNASLELESLVQRFVEPASSVSVPVEQPVEPPSVGSLPSSSDSQLRRIDPPAAAETLQAGAEETHASLDLISTVVQMPPRPGRWLVAASTLLFAVLGGLALGFAGTDVERWMPAAESPVPDAPIEIEAPPIDTPIEDEPAAEDAGATDDGPRVLVWVEIVADEFPSAQVKVNGRMVTPDPTSRVRLPLGTFNVYLRTDKHGEWTKAGRITTGAGHEYRIHMRKPSGLTVVQLD